MLLIAGERCGRLIGRLIRDAPVAVCFWSVRRNPNSFGNGMSHHEFIDPRYIHVIEVVRRALTICCPGGSQPPEQVTPI